MLMGLPHAVKKEFFMEETCNWAIASPSDCSPNDKIRYEQTVEAFRQLDLQNTMKELWKMLAALLHLGNLNFEQDIDDDHAQWRVTTSTRHHLKACSQLLGIDCRELVHVITVRSLVAGSNTVLRPCTTFSECSTRRDTLLRILYRLAFDAVLKEINDKLHRPTASQRHKFLCQLPSLMGVFNCGCSLKYCSSQAFWICTVSNRSNMATVWNSYASIMPMKYCSTISPSAI